MPSPKRERIRENQRRLKEIRDQQEKRRKQRRLIFSFTPVVVVILGILIYQTTKGPSKTSASSKTNSTTATTTSVTPTTANLANVVCPNFNGSSPRYEHFSSAPPMCINPANTYIANVQTDVGSFQITLNSKLAPKTVNNFVFLALYHFYDGLIFHRVIPGFVVQGGDPLGTGAGGPGYQFADELPPAGSYKIGTVAMANSGPNTNGSQFFIVTGPSGEQLPPKYSIFGQVTSGMSVVNTISADGSPSGTPVKVHKMIKVTITQS